jgi:hypothetical protein
MARNVVKEEERLGAAGQHVVDIHRHKIDAQVAYAVVLNAEQQLRTDAVSPGGEDGLLVTSLEQRFGEVDAHQAGEGVVAREHARVIRPAKAMADSLHHFVVGCDIDAGGAVGEAVSSILFCRGHDELERKNSRSLRVFVSREFAPYRHDSHLSTNATTGSRL